MGEGAGVLRCVLVGEGAGVLRCVLVSLPDKTQGACSCEARRECSCLLTQV